MSRCLLLLCCLLGLMTALQAQTAMPKKVGWHYLDKEKDGYRGISLQQAYALLKGRTGSQVVVAVIDSGIDTLQPDLRPVLWNNPEEIPNNGIDDDGNGLVDDYYGWNYLGAPNGENLAMSISDEYRTYHRFKKAFENKTATALPDSLAWQYREWTRAKARLEESYIKAKKGIDVVRKNFNLLSNADAAMQDMCSKKIFTLKDIDRLRSNAANRDILQLWKNIFADGAASNEAFVKGYEAYKKELEEDLVKLDTPPDEARNNLLQDDGYDISRVHYGNHNLSTFSGYHGTSVSSIIGAVRGNDKGIDGIADNVRIMMIRGILGKDEFDKDVALSIRYAVDHGARVINMSFGKYISPDKRWVDEAIEYALSKDVVIVHAAGNDASDNDSTDHYPASRTINGKLLPNVIQAGASGDESLGDVVAPFSNYGKQNVDVFAPGMFIQCAIAGDGTQEASGSSLASPVVAGIAALLRSYFPELKAAEVVDIIKRSGIPVDMKVRKPGTDGEMVALSELCNTGRIVNAAAAIKLALSRVSQ